MLVTVKFGLESLIVKLAIDEVYRSVIFVDSKTDVVAYGRFTEQYDNHYSNDAVTQLFDQSVDVLSNDTDVIFDARLLPIVRHLGKWHITLVHRSMTGVVTVSDALNKSTDNYLGVGG